MYLTDNDAEKTHLLIIGNESQLPNKSRVIAVIFKREKAKSFRPARLAVHRSRVASMTFPNLEKNARIESAIVGGAKPPTKYRGLRKCSSRGIARLGSICVWKGIRDRNTWQRITRTASPPRKYEHYRVDRWWVVEREEGKTARLAVGVPNYGACVDLAKLGKMVPQAL